MKPTFKKIANTGNWWHVQKETTDIKVKKLVCGSISEKSLNVWQVSFMTTARPSQNCPWGWAFVKERFESEQAAREWVKENIEKFNEKYPLYFQE